MVNNNYCSNESYGWRETDSYRYTRSESELSLLLCRFRRGVRDRYKKDNVDVVVVRR